MFHSQPIDLTEEHELFRGTAMNEGERKEASKKNKKAWAAMSPEQKKKHDDSDKDMPHTVDEEMEFHHVRVNEAADSQKIRTITFGKGIKARVGFEEGSASKVISILFPKDEFSIGEAKAWAKEHEYKIVKSMKAESRITEATSKPMKMGQIKRLLKKHGIKGEMGGKGSDWEVEVPNEAERKKFEKALGYPVGGYKTGYGSWVLRPNYNGKGDWGDKSSAHHYMKDESISVYGGRCAGVVVEHRGNLVRVEWTDGYDGPNVIHQSRLRLAGNGDPAPELDEGKGLTPKSLVSYMRSSKSPVDVAGLSYAFGMSHQNVTGMLNTMVKKGVLSAKAGKVKTYTLTPSSIGESRQPQRQQEQVDHRPAPDNIMGWLKEQTDKPYVPGQQRRQIEESYGLEPEDPYAETMMENPMFAGGLLDKTQGIFDHKPTRSNIVSPLHELEEPTVFGGDPGIADERIGNHEEIFGGGREDEFFLESEDPFQNPFNNGHWGIKDMDTTLKG